MNLMDIINRNMTPMPWSEGEKIPWDEPEFSARMLREHLSQEHDMASRRLDKVKAHVRWIHEACLCSTPSRILDLGCGPGLYSNQLARLGHRCTGIDFGPASIAYAKEHAQAENLDCTFVLGDLRETDFGPPESQDLAMMVFGEMNTFKRHEIAEILKKAWNALVKDGVLLLEPHTFQIIQSMGQTAPSWHSSPSGLFCDKPHLYLNEPLWDEAQAVATTRIWIIKAATGEVNQYASVTQAYTDEQYDALLQDCGFNQITRYPSLMGSVDETQAALFALVAHKA